MYLRFFCIRCSYAIFFCAIELTFGLAVFIPRIANLIEHLYRKATDAHQG